MAALTTATAPLRSRLGFSTALLALAVALVLSITVAVTIGPVRIPATLVWQIALHHLNASLVEPDWPLGYDRIVWQIRFPRVLLAAVVGAGLAVVGATLQAAVRNPIADPWILGVSSGATLGAVAVIVLGVSLFGVYSLSAAAFLGALLAFAIVLVLSQRRGRLAPVRLVLAGVAVSYLLGAITSFLVIQANNAEQARTVLFWTLGGFGGARWSYLTVPAAALVAGTAFLTLQRRALNALLVGDETAVSLGIDAQRFRRQALVVCALLTGVMVAVSGGIGFVGLMMPHMVRLLAGPDHRRVLPLAALSGAIFLIWVDVLARMVVAPLEVPVSIITALIGAPFFLFLMYRDNRDFGGAR